MASILDNYLKATGQAPPDPAPPTTPAPVDRSGGGASGKPIPANVGGGQTTQQPGQETTGDFWSLTGPGWSPTSQGVSDWRTVFGAQQPYAASYARATGQQTPADIVKMRADLDAARQRLGPWGAGSASFLGATASPTALANLIPRVGPGVAGGLQSAFTDYGAGKDIPTIERDVPLGFGAGMLSKGLATPQMMGPATSALAGGGGGWLAGHLLGGGSLAEGGAGLGSLLGLNEALRKMSGSAGSAVESALDSPAAQRALQQLLYGGAFAARDRNAGSWIPGQ